MMGGSARKLTHGGEEGTDAISNCLERELTEKGGQDWAAALGREGADSTKTLNREILVK